MKSEKLLKTDLELLLSQTMSVHCINAEVIVQFQETNSLVTFISISDNTVHEVVSPSQLAFCQKLQPKVVKCHAAGHAANTAKD